MRSYRPADTIALPILKSNECSALGTMLVTACRAVEQDLQALGKPLQDS